MSRVFCVTAFQTRDGISCTALRLILLKQNAWLRKGTHSASRILPIYDTLRMAGPPFSRLRPGSFAVLLFLREILRALLIFYSSYNFPSLYITCTLSICCAEGMLPCALGVTTWPRRGSSNEGSTPAGPAVPPRPGRSRRWATGTAPATGCPAPARPAGWCRPCGPR